ncbi:MAG: DUF4382 domain-containing protein [Cyclobacteriaceae bacterium]|nr:DUF4382 domain-containing protein [Cyclobacteriaceae bacterium SS2]
MLKALHKDKKLKSLILAGIYVLMMVWLISCQEPANEVILPAESESFKKESTLGHYLHRLSLLDGSEDNIIDNASSLTVKLPVEVTVRGKQYVINSIEDLHPIQQVYNLNPYISDFMLIKFPIEVIKSDYSSIIINNQEELKQANAIAGNYLYDDIECIDFNYPVSLATYDLINQKAKTIKVENDQALLKAIMEFDENELISFNFPISITVNDFITSINSQIQLQSVIEDQLFECDENDRWYYSDDIILSDISLHLTDAPYPIDMIEEAKVTIDRIDVKTGAANDSVPYITLFNDTLTFDLLELTNGITTALSEVEIPVGTYDFFRVYVENGSILLKDGNFYDLKIPSGESSGILVKPNSPIIITEDGPNEFLFDFDLSRSFIPKGNPNNSAQINGFNFKPTIKISNSSETGTLKGTVTNITNTPVQGVQISLIAADTINAITFSEVDGKYAFLGLTAGDYIVQTEKTGYETSTEQAIISSNQETTIDIIISESQ